MIRSAIVLTLFVASSILITPAVAQESQTPLQKEEAIQPIMPPEESDSVVETGDTLDRLFEKLRRDPAKSSASATAKMIWREWANSGSKSIDLLMNWAANAMQKKQHAKALDLLDQVTVLAPEYAEGWNRRATVHFFMDDYGRSLSDIEATLSLEPRHFGALSGLAVILQRTGKDKAALKTWYEVLEIYPANAQAQQSVLDLEDKLSGTRT